MASAKLFAAGAGFYFLIMAGSAVAFTAGPIASILRPSLRASSSRSSSPVLGLSMEARDAVTGAKFEEKDEAKNPAKRPGHVVGDSEAAAPVSPEIEAQRKRIEEHQSACVKPSWPEEIRTIMAQKNGFATLSTMSKAHEGFPMGSIVGFAADGKGRPFFVFSSLSSHTQNLVANPKASLCVTEPKFKGAADARVTLIGSVTRVEGGDEAELRKSYMENHPGAYWAEFKDFQFYRMNEITDVSFVGGFARAGAVTVDEYMSGEPDPLQAFADPVMNHMNADHTDALKDYVTHLVGVDGDIDTCQMKRLDKYGFDVRVAMGSDAGIIRIPFPEPVSERKAIKEAIVALSKEVAKKKASKEA